MDQLTTFIQDRWLMVVVAIIAILIIVKVVKSILKWLLIIGLAAAILIYGSNYVGEIKEIGGKIADYTKNEAIQALLGESSAARYETSANGGYVVTTNNFKLEGKSGSREVKLSYKGQSITLRLDDALDAFIEGAKSSQSAK